MQKCWINPMVSKVTMKENAALNDRLTSPLNENIGISEILNVFRFQKSVTISLPNR